MMDKLYHLFFPPMGTKLKVLARPGKYSILVLTGDHFCYVMPFEFNTFGPKVFYNEQSPFLSWAILEIKHPLQFSSQSHYSGLPVRFGIDGNQRVI